MYFTEALSQWQITVYLLTVLPHQKENPGEQQGQVAAREHRAELVKTCLPLLTIGSGSDPLFSGTNQHSMCLCTQEGQS